MDIITRRQAAQRASNSTDAASRASHRPDIQGLRAVAVGLVLAYHAAGRFLPGGFVGVDVFFVISGFLITGLMVREAEKTGGLSLAAFYARRAKRLLPAAGLVLLACAGIAYWLEPITERATFAGDIVSAALYVVNWRFAARSVDYLAQDVAPSPVQHYWSLAVEEQFYLVWPLLILAAITVARRRGVPVRAAAGLGVGLIAIPSFAYSILHTAASPQSSFFLTTTRLWELGSGAALALAAPAVSKLGRSAAAALVIGGLAAIVGAALAADDTWSWPGASALIPVLGAVAVIAGGVNAPGGRVGTLLEARPLVWIGGLSYSLYLWHWPMLVAADAAFGPLGAKEGLLVVAVSFGPAWLSHRFVENPVRRSPRLAASPGRAFAVGGAFTSAAVAAALVVVATVPAARPIDDAPGAAILDTMTRAQAADLWRLDVSPEITPDPANAGGDRPVSYDQGCQASVEDVDAIACDYGAVDAATTVALVGDSKALQWQPALDDLGRRLGFRLVTMAKSACAYSDAVPKRDGAPYTTCVAWNAHVDTALAALSPDLVITSQNYVDAVSGQGAADTMREGLEAKWNRLKSSGAPLVVLLDNTASVPRSLPECVAEHRDELSVCSFAPNYSTAELQRAVAEEIGAPVVDLNAAICPADHCPPVIGSVLVYRDTFHLTKTYVMSLESELAAQLADAAKSAGVAWPG